MTVNASKFVEISGNLATVGPSILGVDATNAGKAGNLYITTPQLIILDGARISAETSAGEGNIMIESQGIILRRNSVISTSATGEARGGNIKINTDVLVALENNDIKANAQEAEGGRVSITAQGIFGTQFREQLTEESDITATSALGPDFSGIVELNTPEVDPNRGLIELPETIVDPAALISQNPCTRGSESKFIITGRGGLPPSPNYALSTEATGVGLVEPAPMGSRGAEERTGSTPSMPKPITPAQGWVFNALGEVVLTAYNPTITEPNACRGIQVAVLRSEGDGGYDSFAVVLA